MNNFISNFFFTSWKVCLTLLIIFDKQPNIFTVPKEDVDTKRLFANSLLFQKMLDVDVRVAP